MGHMYYVRSQRLSYFPISQEIEYTPMIKTSRRNFLKVTSAAAGAAFAARNLRAWSASRPVSLAAVPPLSVFNYSQVQLLDGPLRSQFEHNHDLFLHLDEDALLKPFRAARRHAGAGAGHGGLVRQRR